MKYLSFLSLAVWARCLLLAVCNPDAGFQAAVKVEPQNHNYSEPLPDQVSPRGLAGICERQSGCYSPNQYCPLYNKCCSSQAAGCCQFGCILEVANECCSVRDGYCTGTKECCYDGCMPAGADCCLDGGYCPSPYICVLYDGVIGCCTDLTCTVYLSSGIPKTVGYSTQAPAATIYTTDYDYTTTTRAPATTRHTTDYYTNTYYITWTTEIYWYYWYYYYTIIYYPSTYTTRTTTTVYRTTTVTYQATDSLDALESYFSISSELPTPADAESSIPLTPTSGALTVGSCYGYNSSTVTDSRGSTSTNHTSYCETVTAGRSTSSSTARSTSRSSASSTGSTPTNGQLSGSSVRVESLSWMVFVMVPFLVGCAMILL